MFFLPKTQIYTVHIDPSKANPVEKAVFVREGFNIFAFIFGIFWALYQRMWLVALGIAIVEILFVVALQQGLVDGISLDIIRLAFHLMIGFHGNDLRRWTFSRHGYIMPEVVVSDNELRAQQRYFDRVLPA